jgi:hypothetical protein
MTNAVRASAADILKKLNAKEQELLVRVLKIEREKLHLEKPRVKDELLSAVREVFK